MPSDESFCPASRGILEQVQSLGEPAVPAPCPPASAPFRTGISAGTRGRRPARILKGKNIKPLPGKVGSPNLSLESGAARLAPFIPRLGLFGHGD
jgi:hypothetical protein